MKLISKFLLVFFILLFTVSCNNQEQVETRELLGNKKEMTTLLPSEKATWIYTGTGVYYHEMTLEDIISSNHSVYYKIKGEILSDKKNSNYDDFLTEIRYIISQKGWQQELQQSKMLDSKYKGMYLLKFPIEENNTWQEEVLDFDNNKKTITGKIESINVIDDQKIIKVRYSEKNSDYYEIRKIMQGKGIIEFEKNVKINQENHILEYSLEEFYYHDAPIESEIKRFLLSYNKAWESYYNNQALEIFDFIDKDSALSSSILSFEKTDNTEIAFLDLKIESVFVDENQYEIEVNESFSIRSGEEQYTQSYERVYTLVKEKENFKILKIE